MLRKQQLCYLPADSEQGVDYMHEMQYCMAFAQANRACMIERVKEILCDMFPHIRFGHTVNVAHNYASREKHFGQQVIVHRKGAIRAQKGEEGIIPGSQGTKSYIVQGKGNTDSFMSCSHGAGRLMGRREAIRSLDLKAEMQKMALYDILHGIRSTKDLDEAPGAYKDIAHVMESQTDLVEAVTTLTPIAVMKG